MPKRKNGGGRQEVDDNGRAGKRMKTEHRPNHKDEERKQAGRSRSTGLVKPPQYERHHKGHRQNAKGIIQDGAGEEEKVSGDVLKNSNLKVDHSDQKQVAVAKTNKKQRHHEIDSVNEKDSWESSLPVGGCMLDLDPIFSADEQYLLLAFESSIRVYATSTSTLVRTLKNHKTTGLITAFATSSSNTSHLYIARDDGSIEKWDWVNGAKLKKVNIGSKIHALAIPSIAGEENQVDSLYTIDSRGGQWMITAHRLPDDGPSEVKTLLRSPDPITFFQVVGAGKVILASSGQLLLLGRLNETTSPKMKDTAYTWREIRCAEWITCLDIRVEVETKMQRKGSKSTPMTNPQVDVVVGGLQGVIFVYQDLLNNLISKERHKNAKNIGARKLHWHRNAVCAVKWSRDGNYIISGGMETVLALWQVDTGRKQDLPHLSAPIEAVVVSPSGSSYAIRLADNSAMVLSTAELQPTVSVPGIQLSHSRPSATKVPEVPCVRDRESLPRLHRRPAMVGDTAKPYNLLLAVPSSTPSRTRLATTSSTAYLQTYNASSGVQVARQALTRTKITQLNMGPEANIIEEPNVVLLSTSHDEQWLATVEEWWPPESDLMAISIDKDDRRKMQRSRLETYLKFWSWNVGLKVWELLARIDAPHSDNSGGLQSVSRVLDLAEDRSKAGFATIGEDGIVRLWYPKARYRDGVEVRGKDGKAIVSWSCRSVVPLPGLDRINVAGSELSTSRLALSADGSLLAVAYQSTLSSIVHFIDTTDGEITSTYTDLFSTSLIGLGIIDRYLILLSDQLIVWDIVNEELQFVFALKSYDLREQFKLDTTHLALDQKNRVFAVASPTKTIYKSGFTEVGSQILVFDPASSVPLYVTQTSHRLRALLPATHLKGFWAIDSAAEIRMIKPSGKTVVDEMKQVEEHAVSSAGLENIYGKGDNLLFNSTEIDTMGKELSTIDHETVVHQHQLTEMFDSTNPLTLPPIKDLFEQVAGLFSTRAVVAS